MEIKRFCLQGDDPSMAQSIEVDDMMDIDTLKKIVATSFAIVDPKGIIFRSSEEALGSISHILAAGEFIDIIIDGQVVRDPPGPKGLPLVGSHCEVYPDHIGNHQRLFEMYGKLFQTTVMGRTVYHTNDPILTAHVFSETEFFTKDINHAHPLYGVKSPHAGVFLTNTATDEWRTAHKFIVPAFSPKAIDHYTPRMQTLHAQLSSQLVGQLILGVDFHHFETTKSPVHDIPLAIVKLLGLNKKVTSWGDWYAWLPFGDPKRLRDTWHQVGSLVGKASKEASVGEGDLNLQEAATKSQNLADYLLRATDSKGNKIKEESRNSALIVTLTAGFVTTSSLLSWLLYGVVTYPEIQEKLLQELVDNEMSEEQEMTGEFIGRLTFLDKFVKETQRRHTTSFQPARTARKDLILPGGYKIPKDGVIISEVHHLHNNPEIWSNPTKFDPGRWDTEEVRSRHRGAYLPFAMGPRMCVATNFVAREVKMFIAMLVFRYHFTREGNEPIEYDSMFQTVKPSNLYVRSTKRKTWPTKNAIV